MVELIKKILNQKKLKNNLLAFLAEMEKNLEIFYVADQRQFITQPFLTKAWAAVESEAVVRKHEAILVYAAAVADLNRLLSQQREYEHWYAGDLKNKTPDNARKLHTLKQDLDRKLKNMEPLIIPAGQALEKEMVQLGLLTYGQ